MTRTEFFKACRNFDWFYVMSDDSRVYRQGREAEDKMKQEAAHDTVKANMFQAWNAHVCSGEAFGKEKLPEPQREEFPADND